MTPSKVMTISCPFGAVVRVMIPSSFSHVKAFLAATPCETPASCAICPHAVVTVFSKGNLAAIKAVCRQFTLLCQRLDLFGGELIAIDGSKFRADNSRKRNFNLGKPARIIKAIDERLTAYLAEMEKQGPTIGGCRPPSAQISTPLTRRRSPSR
jgi:hypothetical protein